MYTSGFGSGVPLLSAMSNVESTVHAPSATPFASLCSIHLSGIVNGLTHVSALAGEASAVADAPTSAVGTPKIPPRNVGIALPRAMVRYTDTATRVGLPDGSLGNVTSEVRTDGGCSAMRF